MALNPKIKEKVVKKTNGNVQMYNAVMTLLQAAEQGKQLKRPIATIDKQLQPV